MALLSPVQMSCNFCGSSHVLPPSRAADNVGRRIAPGASWVFVSPGPFLLLAVGERNDNGAFLCSQDVASDAELDLVRVFDDGRHFLPGLAQVGTDERLVSADAE